MDAIESIEEEEKIEINPPYDAAESARRYEEKMTFLASINEELSEKIEALRNRSDFDKSSWDTELDNDERKVNVGV